MAVTYLQGQKQIWKHYKVLFLEEGWRTHSMQILGEIPFIKPQNNTETTDEHTKTMKN